MRGMPMADVEKGRDLFWEADLKDIERSFLGCRKVTDLPIKLDDRVPPGGNPLLRRVVRLGRYKR